MHKTLDEKLLNYVMHNLTLFLSEIFGRNNNTIKESYCEKTYVYLRVFSDASSINPCPKTEPRTISRAFSYDFRKPAVL